MDRSVLLLLFGVQVFLLIAAFSSADAAAVLNNDGQDHRPFPQRLNGVQGLNRPISRSHGPRCSDFPGGCGAIGRAGPTTKSPPGTKNDKEKPKWGPIDYIVPPPGGVH